jgi:hypothetical protein
VKKIHYEKHIGNVENVMDEAIQEEHIETMRAESTSDSNDAGKTSKTSDACDGPLPAGTTILNGQYRLLELLHRRPRVNLYLGRRLPRTDVAKQHLEAQEPLVVIRELVLVGLPRQLQKRVESAAFEEFVSPVMFGSPRLPGTGDRVRVEGERHYLVMQLRGAHGGRGGEKGRPTVAITLAELLLNRQQWPLWLDRETALGWGVQLCRIVARLHRLGLVLGDLNPNTILVDEGGPAKWAPVLLVFWPPAPQFWLASSTQREQAAPWSQIFPVAGTTATNAFAAPESLDGAGEKCDERSDVYSLAAILYLLLTRYAPVAALRRRQAGNREATCNHPPQGATEYADALQITDGIALIPPRLFNARIPVVLEQALLRALSLEPSQRYPSVFAFLEVLEKIDMNLVDTENAEYVGPKASPLGKVVRWVRHGA